MKKLNVYNTLQLPGLKEDRFLNSYGITAIKTRRSSEIRGVLTREGTNGQSSC